nr:DNA polymerase [Candidatus Gracilibacteria bacterium]
MPQIYDTILGEYIKNPGARGLSLDDLALRDMDYKMISYDEVTGRKKLNFKDVDLQSASIYSAEDVYITWELYKKQEKDNIVSNKVLIDIEIPLVDVLKDMEITGVKIDRDKLKGIGILLESEITKLEKEIYSLAGEEFNIKSPSQVAKILFEKLQLKSGKKTKTGFSVDSEVLEELAKNHEIARKLIDYRTYTKLLSNYVEGLLAELDDNDLIHTNYNQTIASTGRLSSTNPNLQNIPTGKGISGEIRNAFIPLNNDEVIMAFDYSQVEVRVLAIMSGDQNLLNAFKNNIDIHYNTAKFIFGKDDISKNKRKVAKSVNFGVIYGISAFGLSKMIDASIADCKKYIDKFYENYPQVREFFDAVVDNCKKTGYVETMFGRRRLIPGINDSNRIIAEAAKREAINMPIQGTAADIIKLAMIKIDKFIKSNKMNSKLIMQVHDELVFTVKKSEKEKLEKEVKNIMESVLVDKPIKLIVDVGHGKSWGEAK